MSQYERTKTSKYAMSTKMNRTDEQISDDDFDDASEDCAWDYPDDISMGPEDVSCMTRETTISQRALKSFEGSYRADELPSDVERGSPHIAMKGLSIPCRSSMETKTTKSSESALTEHSNRQNVRRLFIWGSFATVLLAGVVVALLFLVGPLKQKSYSSSDKAINKDDVVTTNPREATLMSILSGVSPIGLYNNESAQFMAKEWIVRTDSLRLTLSNTTTNERILQRYALAVFYFATNGPSSWTTNNWLEGDECVNQFWTGISCDENNNVRALAFDNAGLEGYIPEELGVLTMLENLVIKNHPKITGQIPTTLGKLTVLGQLGLYDNALTGGIPNELYSATNLNYINFQGNQLQGSITIRIEKLNNLEKLILFNNRFSGALPIRQMAKTGLKFLGLGNNEFEGTIPDQISNLPSMEYLYLNNNNFTGTLTANYGRMTNLVSLNLDRNSFSGSIPIEISGAKAISFLSMQKNMLTGFLPTQINQLSNLHTLNVATNYLTGPIPPTGNMHALVNLYLYQNQVTGTLPSTLGDMRSLEVAFLSSNKLTGPITPFIGNASKTLKGLYLSDNALEGTIPESLCSLSYLTSLFVDTNSLTGMLPSCLGTLSMLRQLYVFQNRLTGEVPASFQDLRALSGLGLENNHLVGSVPEGICEIRPLGDIWSDCGGSTPEIDCKCCTCCPSATCR